MQKTYLAVYDESSDLNIEVHTKCGYALDLISTSPQMGRPAVVMRELLIPAIKHDFIKFYFNCDGVVVGYVIWAFLAIETEQRIIRTGSLQLHPSEWNEGESLWILDFIARPGHAKYILAHLRDDLFHDPESLRYFRCRNKQLIIKEVSRLSKLTFFRQQKSQNY